MKEETTFVFQKLKRISDDKYVLAERYYSVLSVLNNLRLTEREIQLVAFAAIRGNISYANIREDFCRKHSTTPPTINNMISRLKKIGVMVKDGGKVKVNPRIVIDFSKDVILRIDLLHKDEKEG